MKLFFVTILSLLACFNVQAAGKRYFQNPKFPSAHALFENSFSNLAAASTNNIKSAFAGLTTSTAVNLTSFLAQNDLPRNIVITPAGTAADMANCTVTVSGLNIHGQSISEDFAFTVNTTTAAIGAKAFKTITNVAFPSTCEDSPYGVTWSIGSGEKIGLNGCMDQAGSLIQSTIDGAFEATRATAIADSDEVEKNTLDFNGTMNGASDFKAFFLNNMACP